MDKEKLEKAIQIAEKIGVLEEKLTLSLIDPFMLKYIDKEFIKKIENEIKEYLNEKVKKLKKEFDEL